MSAPVRNAALPVMPGDERIIEAVLRGLENQERQERCFPTG